MRRCSSHRPNPRADRRRRIEFPRPIEDHQSPSFTACLAGRQKGQAFHPAAGAAGKPFRKCPATKPLAGQELIDKATAARHRHFAGRPPSPFEPGDFLPQRLDQFDGLPWQHLMFFRRDEEREEASRAPRRCASGNVKRQADRHVGFARARSGDVRSAGRQIAVLSRHFPFFFPPSAAALSAISSTFCLASWASRTSAGFLAFCAADTEMAANRPA